MKFDKDITKIKRVTFFFETQCRSQIVTSVNYQVTFNMCTCYLLDAQLWQGSFVSRRSTV